MRPFRYPSVILFFLIVSSLPLRSEITLLSEYHLNDQSLFFDGIKVGNGAPNREGGYDYFFGNALTPHGDCIKVYKQYVFMTWYRGGKEDRHVMLTRLNTETGAMATIEFPHRHTGYLNQWWIGETHNTIAVGISPKNGTIHLLYDMHAYNPTKPAAFATDYFRYSYSVANAAEVPDDQFTLEQFVKSPDGDYKHLTMNGVENSNIWGGLTYPKFFLNQEGDLFMYMRKGSAYNGGFIFTKYNGVSTWEAQTQFNVTSASNKGLPFDYGVYGEMKYANGKVRLAFQRRSNDRNDRYIYQNGIYYAYSDSQGGKSDWKNHQGQAFDLPLIDPDFIKVYEPGDLVEGTQKDSIHMVGSFDFNVTDRGDEHIIARVKDNQFNVTKYVHAYRPAGETEFIISTDFAGGEELYASGNNIFMITLKNGRPFVQTTEGGTNDWVTVYAPTTGRTFDKGIPYIHEGKLYYYLKVPGSGDTRTTYLQIINLDASLPPLSAGRDQVVTDSDLDGFANVELKGKLGPDTQVDQFSWTENGVEIATGLTATVNLEFGVHPIKLTATGNAETHEAWVTITVQPPANTTPTLMVGWEKWDTPNATVANGASGTFSASSNWKLSVFGSSQDGTFGNLSSPPANTDRSADAPQLDGLRNGTDADSISFTITNGDDPIELIGFHFDASRRGDSDSEYTLEVLEGSAIENGPVDTGNIPKSFGTDLVDFDIDLSALSDRRLEPGESATFKLNFTDGGGINLDFDNVAISRSPNFMYLGYPDTDGDRLPDYWETFYLGDLSHDREGDADADGRKHIEEFVEGTLPNDNRSALRFTIEWENGQRYLTWPNRPGRSFRILTSSRADADAWEVLATELSATDETHRVALPEEAAFYRLEAKREL